MNRFADHIASKSHFSPLRPLSVPTSTFFMDPYVAYHPTHGYIESGVSQFLNDQLASTSLPAYPPRLISRLLYDNHAPPSHPYTHALSAYSAAIQLYARSDQLDSASTLSKRMPVTNQPWCRFGCPVFETTHHIFTVCPRFSCLREGATQKLVSTVSTALGAFQTSPDDHPQLMSVVSNLFHNDNVWPMGHSFYYYGVIPVLRLGSGSVDLEHRRLAHRRLLHRLANDCHTAAIYLASRIWGLVRKTFSPYSPHHPPKILELPSHLSYIASSSPRVHISLA